MINHSPTPYIAAFPARRLSFVCDKDMNDAITAINSHDALVKASQKVLDGLNARIAHADPKAVPMFDGIADLYIASRSRQSNR